MLSSYKFHSKQTVNTTARGFRKREKTWFVKNTSFDGCGEAGVSRYGRLTPTLVFWSPVGTVGRC